MNAAKDEKGKNPVARKQTQIKQWIVAFELFDAKNNHQPRKGCQQPPSGAGAAASSEAPNVRQVMAAA